MRVTIDTDAKEIRATRTVRESGNSMLVTLPPEICQMAGVEAEDDVTLSIGFDEEEIHVRKNGGETDGD